MSSPLCLLCLKPFAIIQQHAGPKQKRFCTEACNTAWWNEQPIHPVIPKVDASHPRAVELRLKRTQLVTLEKADPYTYGYIPGSRSHAAAFMQVHQFAEKQLRGFHGPANSQVLPSHFIFVCLLCFCWSKTTN